MHMKIIMAILVLFLRWVGLELGLGPLWWGGVGVVRTFKASQSESYCYILKKFFLCLTKNSCYEIQA
jgi:hypothetical protein